ncbi:MAG: hypothetical protein ACKO9B_08675 [Planctomycetota bacterium]
MGIAVGVAGGFKLSTQQGGQPGPAPANDRRPIWLYIISLDFTTNPPIEVKSVVFGNSVISYPFVAGTPLHKSEDNFIAFEVWYTGITPIPLPSDDGDGFEIRILINGVEQTCTIEAKIFPD